MRVGWMSNDGEDADNSGDNDKRAKSGGDRGQAAEPAARWRRGGRYGRSVPATRIVLSLLSDLTGVVPTLLRLWCSVRVAGAHQHPAVGEVRDVVVAVAQFAQHLFVVLALARRLPIRLGAGVDGLGAVGAFIGLGGIGEVPGAPGGQ